MPESKSNRIRSRKYFREVKSRCAIDFGSIYYNIFGGVDRYVNFSFFSHKKQQFCPHFVQCMWFNAKQNRNEWRKKNPEFARISYMQSWSWCTYVHGTGMYRTLLDTSPISSKRLNMFWGFRFAFIHSFLFSHYLQTNIVITFLPFLRHGNTT